MLTLGEKPCFWNVSLGLYRGQRPVCFCRFLILSRVFFTPYISAYIKAFVCSMSLYIQGNGKGIFHTQVGSEKSQAGIYSPGKIIYRDRKTDAHADMPSYPLFTRISESRQEFRDSLYESFFFLLLIFPGKFNSQSQSIYIHSCFIFIHF